MKSVRVVLAGGGTGGHLYPALAIAHAVLAINKNANIDFVGSYRGLENKIVPAAGFRLHRIPIEGLSNVGITQKIKTLFLFPYAFLKSLAIILYLRPTFVIGVGGYASGPVLLAAALLRFETAIWEPNAHPGLTNRILARFVRHIFVVFSESRKYFSSSERLEVVGLPVRATMRPVIREPHQRLRVLVFGGSQGARGINRVVVTAIQKIVQERKEALKNHNKDPHPWFDQTEFVHQIGRMDFNMEKQNYEVLGLKNVECLEYIHNMHERYANADVVICRSGASTIAELAACSKCAILVPLPTAADDHQRKNAQALADQNAAILCPQIDFTPEKFIEYVQMFLADRSLVEKYEERIKLFHQPNASRDLAQRIVGDAT